MKKLLFILPALFFSCTPNDDNLTADCNCETVVNSVSFNIPDGNGGVNVYSTVALQNDCTHYQHSTSLPGVVPVGTKICN